MFPGIAPNPCPGEVLIPPGVVLDDGLTEDEAVALALWNNRNFLSTLSNLGIARGDLVQAGLLTNPQLNLLFPPIGSKQLEWTVFLPIEAAILRRRRVEIAERDFQRICNELVQNGLNVARDARVAFADFQLAVDRYEMAEQAAEVRGNIAKLAERRLEAGDIRELEVIATRVDSSRTRADAAGLKQAVTVAEASLKNVLGIAALDTPLTPVASDVVNVPTFDAETLIGEALATRPDVKAARVSIEAAQHRVELAKKSFLRIDAVVDGNNGGAGPSNVGPGLRFEIPIFNRNQGLIIRSQWTVDQASQNYQSIRDTAITEVRTSLAGVEQARSNLQILREEVLPDLNDIVKLSESAYEGGGDPYFLVLQSTSVYIDTKTRELELQADLRRAIAELDRSVGRRVFMQSGMEPSVIETQPAHANDVNLLMPPLSSTNTNAQPSVTVVVIQSNSGNESVSPDIISEALRTAAVQMEQRRSEPAAQVILQSASETEVASSGRRVKPSQ
ncbi:MAG: TolC family protein [Planctomycetaceae bacterium]